jgi:hypothetical protein
MATVYRCDKCHCEYPSWAKMTMVRVPTSTDEAAELAPKYDLCVDCLRGVREWLKPNPKVYPAK